MVLSTCMYCLLGACSAHNMDVLPTGYPTSLQNTWYCRQHACAAHPQQARSAYKTTSCQRRLRYHHYSTQCRQQRQHRMCDRVCGGLHDAQPHTAQHATLCECGTRNTTHQKHDTEATDSAVQCSGTNEQAYRLLKRSSLASILSNRNCKTLIARQVLLC